ncbi:hypothetical protein NKH28_15950 [Mesorhizobium sp. M1227]|uniref:hypothetical protein n=1 Tax=Mesorhizobium sp. M1227 TaxID=2957071 RepID=UPI003334C970
MQGSPARSGRKPYTGGIAGKQQAAGGQQGDPGGQIVLGSAQRDQPGTTPSDQQAEDRQQRADEHRPPEGNAGPANGMGWGMVMIMMLIRVKQNVTSSERMDGSMVSDQPDQMGQGGVTIL